LQKGAPTLFESDFFSTRFWWTTGAKQMFEPTPPRTSLVFALNMGSHGHGTGFNVVCVEALRFKRFASLG
jgi:hypothetical protein